MTILRTMQGVPRFNFSNVDFEYCVRQMLLRVRRSPFFIRSFFGYRAMMVADRLHCTGSND